MPNFVPVVYSNGGPVLSSGGASRVACVHLAQWLKVYDALQVARGRGHITYYQTVGGADASAGTHLCGSAWDMAYTSDAAIMDAREMGAADWHRRPGYNGWPSSGANHVHGLIRCGDNACNGYQYTAWLSGHNGLGLNGVGAGDTLPKPSTIRTWQQGIAWAQAQMGVGPMAQTNSPAPQEATMSAAQVEALTALTQQVLDVVGVVRDVVKGEGVNLADIAPLYLQFTGREAVDAESQNWFVIALVGKLSLRQVADQIAASDEAHRWAIASAYRAYLSREVTPAEVTSWLAMGLSFDGLLGGIAGSPEAKAYAATKK